MNTMLITLLSDAHKEGDQVSFRFDGGQGIGTWLGRGPQTAQIAIDAEFDTPSEITWEELTLDPPPGPAMTIKGESIQVRGPIVEITDYGLLSLGIGTGSLTVEISGEPALVPIGREASFSIFSIDLYPTNT
jgi:hypothetical protein